MPRPLIHVLACTLLALGPWGCVHTTEWVDDEPPRSYGPLDKTRRELGYGKFAAFDFGNHIVVYATGYECSTSWRHELVPERGPDGRGVLTLYRQAPFVAGSAITPFTVSAVVPPPVGPYVTHGRRRPGRRRPSRRPGSPAAGRHDVHGVEPSDDRDPACTNAPEQSIGPPRRDLSFSEGPDSSRP